MAEDANEALLYAARNGCLQGVKDALKAGADIDYEDDEITALLHASINGDVDIARLLLRQGASVSKRTKQISCGPLHAAAGNGHTEVVKLLVHHGATLAVRDAYQRTPLMVAIMYKQVDTGRQLIELGARVDLTDDQGVAAKRYCEFYMKGEDLDCARKEMLGLIEEALKTKLLRCCNPTCGKPGYRSTLKLCAQCKLTRYCSRDCQKQHWTVGHKKSCGHDAYTGNGPDPLYLKLTRLRIAYQNSLQQT
ncbi:PREDICTED: kinase D-interacting substrate of 220 kDa-like [Branchiostoma belcheri]|uniref:Kinase D-interacting substrate of 220 kDa-like n=1 Tax=Branchiostoma belcheri TaxID=7741 RepID=A0A6P5ASU0_BRABE|nr:PREDICTED: kinase D-interacting substrate of 220 kDa-like [Branchiostoma belcheri]